MKETRKQARKKRILGKRLIKKNESVRESTSTETTASKPQQRHKSTKEKSETSLAASLRGRGERNKRVKGRAARSVKNGARYSPPAAAAFPLAVQGCVEPPIAVRGAECDSQVKNECEGDGTNELQIISHGNG